MSVVFFFFQAEDGIRDAQESRGLGDVYKRQCLVRPSWYQVMEPLDGSNLVSAKTLDCLLYTSDAADEEDSVDVCCIFFFSSRRRHTRCSGVLWARRCV